LPRRWRAHPFARRLASGVIRSNYCTGSLAGDITFGPCRADGSDKVRMFFTPTNARGVTIRPLTPPAKHW
jgi:hypothetical protein